MWLNPGLNIPDEPSSLPIPGNICEMDGSAVTLKGSFAGLSMI